MIDPSIYKIYKEEKKVFIPDFGAIIYSEATDSIDFNELLTFDDGKVIEEIQSRQKSGKREARKALKEHIKKVKAKLDDGKSHLIRGLGYLYKDESGSYAIQKNKPGSKSSGKKKPKKDEQIPVAVPPESLDNDELTPEAELAVEDTEKATEADEIEMSVEEDSAQVDEILEEEATEPEQEVSFESDDTEKDLEYAEEFEQEPFSEETADSTDTENEDGEYAYKPYLSQENEDVQEYYKRKDDYYNDGNNRARLWYMIAAAIILLLVAGGLYYFVFDNGDSNEFEEMVVTTDSNDAEEVEMVNEGTSDVDVESSTDLENDQPAESLVAAQETSAPSEDLSTVPNFNAGSNLRTYSLILGSFQVDENANNFYKYLTDKQRDVSIFNWGGSFHFVGFEHIEGKDEALKLLAVMREEEEPTAWIIRNKQN